MLGWIIAGAAVVAAGIAGAVWMYFNKKKVQDVVEDVIGWSEDMLNWSGDQIKDAIEDIEDQVEEIQDEIDEIVKKAGAAIDDATKEALDLLIAEKASMLEELDDLREKLELKDE